MDSDAPLSDSMASPLRGFVSGPENRILVTLYRSLLINEDLCALGFNPAVLYGPTAVGKSHIALGLAEAWHSEHPNAHTCVVSARDWALGFASAVRDELVSQWRNQQRKSSLFVLEDISLLHKRRAAQRELVTLLDDFVATDTPCLITARANPLTMSELIPELSSRLANGLNIPIKYPGNDTRQRLIIELAKKRHCKLTAEAVDFLAAHSGNTFVSMRRAILTCCVDRPNNRHFTLSDVKRIPSETIAKLPLNSISTTVARYFGITNKQLVGPSRRLAVSRARGVAIYLCRELTDCSLKRIGQHFGNRDHTTIIHSCRVTEQRSHTDSDVQTAIDELVTILKSRLA